jgi:HK97 family phage portal protein
MTLATPWSVGRQVTVRDASGGIFPPPGGLVGSGVPGPYVYDASSARRVPAVARCLQVYSGLCKQMHMDAWRGADILPRPRLLDRPDPTRARSWYVHVNVEDYLLEGNAISLITGRGVDGWPLSVQWVPAAWVYIVWTIGMPRPDYYLLGQPLNFDDVIHVRRGADRFLPVRGVGVVEEFLGTLDRVASEEAYERSTLAGAAVPSVAIITPQATFTQDVADQAKADWMDKFAGAQRLPAILPNGTQVIPLAWSPSDTQLVEARKMSLTDVANAFNIDSYWVGAPVSGMTYRTAAPQYQQVLLTSLEPVLADFEQVWSDAWLPRGTNVQFGRDKLLREDLPTTSTAMSTLVGAGIASPAEVRSYLMGNPLDLSGPAPSPPKPPPPPVAPVPAAAGGNQPPQEVPAR